MSKKHLFTLLIVLFIGVSIQAQHNYLLFDYSLSQYKLSNATKTSATLSEKLNRCEGTYTGGSFHFALGRKNSLGIGMGLQKINYQKEWQGTFPESNQFGVAQVNGEIAYWSFPISYRWIAGQGPRGLNRFYCSRKDRFHFGFSFTYTPCFEGSNSFSVTTVGGADLNTFLSTFHSNEQAFQHSFTVGLSNQLYLLNNHLRMDVEPYAGIESGYFKESGTSINNINFGLRLQIGFLAKLPHISIEREVNPGDSEEKKKKLKEKQKEIEDKIRNEKRLNYKF